MVRGRVSRERYSRNFLASNFQVRKAIPRTHSNELTRLSLRIISGCPGIVRMDTLVSRSPHEPTLRYLHWSSVCCTHCARCNEPPIFGQGDAQIGSTLSRVLPPDFSTWIERVNSMKSLSVKLGESWRVQSSPLSAIIIAEKTALRISM